MKADVKKLALHQETLRNLTRGEMQKVPEVGTRIPCH